MAINIVCVSGNLVADPEKRGNKEHPCIAFTVACNMWDGKAEVANFFDVVMFGNQAAAMSKILVKGMAVTIQGTLQQNKWQAEDGSNRSKVEIVARELTLPRKVEQNEKENIPF